MLYAVFKALKVTFCKNQSRIDLVSFFLITLDPTVKSTSGDASILRNLTNGSKAQYPLGTIFKNKDYLLLAFSKFDADNRAYLDSRSMWECLINMWNEIDICHAGNSVGIPLMGSGITRTHNIHLSEQEILELIILSLRVSGIKINWNSKFKIIIYPPNAKNINFYKLRSLTD